MFRQTHHLPKWYTQRNEGNDLMPKEVIEAVERVAALGKEAIVKKEHGKWIVIENGRRIVFKEK